MGCVRNEITAILISSPNLITLLGLFCVLFNFGLQLYFDPAFDGTCPNWVYFRYHPMFIRLKSSFGVGLWIYASFDAIDGKQARRTGTSGPLGELFDHSIAAPTLSTKLSRLRRLEYHGSFVAATIT